MYTKEHIEGEKWWIVDPDWVYICIVLGKDNADALLTHLNS